MFSAGEKTATWLVWRRTHTGSYGTAEFVGKPSRDRGFAVWRAEDGKVAEIPTVHDQFALLTQMEYRAEEVYPD
jgi:SnoaL-like polyketide cyclase